MKARKRLTREESKEVTRLRLIEAAERLFIRRGFDDASVEEISEMAGYSRGAFYSNFENKEQVFLAVIDRRRPKALDDILQGVSEPLEQIAAVQNWFANQWRLKDFIALRMEFSRRAIRDRSVRTHLAELFRQELETYSASVGRVLCAKDEIAAERPEIVVLVLLASTLGLGILAVDADPEREHLYSEAAALVFNRMTVSQISHLGQLLC
ncbi:MAG TPA: TetR family transcriptional regulator [Bryobacteraceae bacterium]|nr:TetR family transcriptional regulator [Bryobacteraceae bacterium]